MALAGYATMMMMMMMMIATLPQLRLDAATLLLLLRT